MTSQVQKRRGTTTEHSTFTGAEGEITVDTTKDTAVVHDGVTTGGQPLAREDLDNVSASDVASKLNGTAISGVDINSGSIDGTAIGANSASTGVFTSLTATGTTTLAGATTSADITFGDNDKAIFGAGSDLQIYHDGSNSFIRDAGTGNLVIRGTNLNLQKDGGESYISMVADGAVTAYYDNAAKLTTTSTGIDVTGTATMDGLTVDGQALIHNDDTTDQLIIDNYTPGSFATPQYTDVTFRGYAANQGARIRGLDRASSVGRGGMILQTRATSGSLQDALFIDGDGDISFYEDTGTTAKFFWDASAESLGIGTSSPSTALDIIGANGAQFRIANTTADATLKNAYHSVRHYTNAEQDFVWALAQSNANTNDLNLGGSTSVGNAATSIKFFTAANNTTTTGSERMRIDSSGYVFVGKTSSNIATAGVELAPNDRSSFTRANGFTILANRTGTDGDIVQFRKDGTTVGSIGVVTDGAYKALKISSAYPSTGNIKFDNVVQIYDTNWSSQKQLIPQVDNDTNLGNASKRFKDLYLSGGVYLGGTGAANLLDDYEEGTWTPDIQGSVAGTATYTFQYGWYTKVGNLVTASFIIVWSAHTGSGGSAAVNGLPFSSNSATLGRAWTYLHHSNYAIGTDKVLGGAIVQNSNKILLVTSSTTGGAESTSIALDTASTLVGTITYRV